MAAPDQTGITDVSPNAASDFLALIASLRTAGADRFDGVRLHYLEALAKRALQHHGSVKRVLDARLAQALATFQERFDAAQADASNTIARCLAHSPHAAKELQQRFASGDFKSVQSLVAALGTGERRDGLRALVRQLEQATTDNPEPRLAGNAGARSELKTLREFRNTWSKLSADKQVAQALGQAPMNAGPINSHSLVLRSLALMRTISPDYLNRFMTYADTLLCLDQGEKKNEKKSDKPKTAVPKPKKPPAAKAGKK